MQKQRVLVIGSKDHPRADCFDWLEVFPNIEDFDTIVIDMQSLTQPIYDKAQSKISAMRLPIFNILNTGREVFCIFSEPLHPSPLPTSLGVSIKRTITFNNALGSNFDWFPVILYLNAQPCGLSYSIKDTRFAKYFELITKWEFELNVPPDMQSLGTIVQSLLYYFGPIAVNKSQKVIAGSLRLFTNIDRKYLPKGAIHLPPPSTKVSSFQAVETILDLILGTSQNKVVQPWRRSIEVPNEKEIENNIKIKSNEIQNINADIAILKQQVQKWDSYRDLLSGTGDELELIVQKTLADIGITSNRTEKGAYVDLIGEGVAIEVTGIKKSIDTSSEKVNQIGRFHANYQKGEKIILIVNTFMDLALEERKKKDSFTDPIKKYLESMSVCFMTTQSLYKLWTDVVLGKTKAEQVKEKILRTNGEVTS